MPRSEFFSVHLSFSVTLPFVLSLTEFTIIPLARACLQTSLYKFNFMHVYASRVQRLLHEVIATNSRHISGPLSSMLQRFLDSYLLLGAVQDTDSQGVIFRVRLANRFAHSIHSPNCASRILIFSGSPEPRAPRPSPPRSPALAAPGKSSDAPHGHCLEGLVRPLPPPGQSRHRPRRRLRDRRPFPARRGGNSD